MLLSSTSHRHLLACFALLHLLSGPSPAQACPVDPSSGLCPAKLSSRLTLTKHQTSSTFVPSSSSPYPCQSSVVSLLGQPPPRQRQARLPARPAQRRQRQPAVSRRTPALPTTASASQRRRASSAPAVQPSAVLQRRCCRHFAIPGRARPASGRPDRVRPGSGSGLPSQSSGSDQTLCPGQPLSPVVAPRFALPLPYPSSQNSQAPCARPACFALSSAASFASAFAAPSSACPRTSAAPAAASSLVQRLSVRHQLVVKLSRQVIPLSLTDLLVLVDNSTIRHRPLLTPLSFRRQSSFDRPSLLSFASLSHAPDQQASQPSSSSRVPGRQGSSSSALSDQPFAAKSSGARPGRQADRRPGQAPSPGKHAPRRQGQEPVVRPRRQRQAVVVVRQAPASSSLVSQVRTRPAPDQLRSSARRATGPDQARHPCLDLVIVIVRLHQLRPCSYINPGASQPSGHQAPSSASRSAPGLPLAGRQPTMPVRC